MSSSFTVESLHHLLRSLLAPTWAERRAADDLLFQLFGACGDPLPEPIAQLLDRATDRFGSERDPVLAHVLAFHCNATALAFDARMAESGRAAEPKWIAFALVQQIPLEPPQFASFDLYGLGVSWFLRSQAGKLGHCVPMLVRALRHPEPTVQDLAWATLGANPAAARDAITHMFEIAFARGSWCWPDTPMRDLARVLEAHPEFIATLVDAARSEHVDQRLEAISAMLKHLTVVPQELFDALFEALLRRTSTERHFTLMPALATASTRLDTYRATELLAQARTDLGSSHALERAAAAWALAILAREVESDPALLCLLGDCDWIVRSNAAAAAAKLSAPSVALVARVAQGLGDFAGYDGLPHEHVVTTLGTWGAKASAAVPHIEAWLRKPESAGDIDPDSLLRLLSAIGPPARVLRETIARYVDARFAAADDGTRETAADTTAVPDQVAEYPGLEADLAGEWAQAMSAEFAELQVQLAANSSAQEERMRNAQALAARIGFDSAEDIPGTPTKAELLAAADDEARLRLWLQEAQSG